mmetsp:Transcript_35656/g.80093  ORF Transcript_35656/g.80093 Transcript_35656/m.80093 type:complete len:338 (+) Transcript_35656:239-1252(+)
MGSTASSHAQGPVDDADVFYDCVEIGDGEEMEFNSGSAARDDGDDPEKEDDAADNAQNESAGRENDAANPKRAHASVDRLSPKFTPQKRRRRGGRDGDAGPGANKPSPHAFELRWDRHLAALRSYGEENDGDVDPPPNYKTEDGLKIGKWVENQKYSYRYGTLTQERYRTLKDMGVVFPKRTPVKTEAFSPARNPSQSLSPDPAERWEQYRQMLIAHKKARGTVVVSRRDNPTLNRWIENQKASYRKKSMTDERARLLVEVGIELGMSNEEKWQAKLAELRAYRQEFGNCDVPQKHPVLGRWVNKQRQKNASKKLSTEHTAQLVELGFFDGAVGVAV